MNNRVIPLGQSVAYLPCIPRHSEPVKPLERPIVIINVHLHFKC